MQPPSFSGAAKKKNMAIAFDSLHKVFKLDTQNTSYVFCLRYDKYLAHVYCGARINDTDIADCVSRQVYEVSPHPKETGKKFFLDTEMLEYSCLGAGDMRTDALRIRRVNGCRDTLLKYVSHEILNGCETPGDLPCSRSADGRQTLVERSAKRRDTYGPT